MSWKKSLFLKLSKMPPPVSAWAGNLALKLGEHQQHQSMRRLLGERWEGSEPGPLPPPEAIMKTNVMSAQDKETVTKRAYYLSSAYQQNAYYAHTLLAHGFDTSRFKRLFEFGCGSGRLIRHWRGVRDLELIGSDVDADNIAWCQQNLEGMSFHENHPDPPLQFLAEDSVDLIIASSVFTHIDLKRQAAWINEMKRVLRQGGMLLADVHGAHHRQKMLNDEQIERLERVGGLVIGSDDPVATISTREIGSCDTFQTEAEVRSVFGRSFKVLEYRPRVLDSVICQKPIVNNKGSGRVRYS